MNLITRTLFSLLIIAFFLSCSWSYIFIHYALLVAYVARSSDILTTFLGIPLYGYPLTSPVDVFVLLGVLITLCSKVIWLNVVSISLILYAFKKEKEKKRENKKGVSTDDLFCSWWHWQFTSYLEFQRSLYYHSWKRVSILSFILSSPFFLFSI